MARRGTILRPRHRLAIRMSLSTPRSLAFLSLLSFALPTLATLSGSQLRAQCTYSWPASAFGSGCNDAVTALATLSNGDVVAGGRFTDAGGVACNRIARWDGSVWSTLGTGADANVNALLLLANGDLLAGGSFLTTGGVATNCIARWNGSTWNALGTGVASLAPFGANVQALALLPNGDVVAAGNFANVGGVAAANIARWNGTVWAALGTGTNGGVRALTVTNTGDLIATGAFTTAGGVVCNSIARWNGTNWSALGTGLGVFGGNALATMTNGDVVVGGSFLTAGGVACTRIARWNGASWSALSTGLNNVVTALRAMPSGDLVVGGLFTLAGGGAANYVARWNGATWQSLASGTNAAVADLLQLPNGDVVAGGDFTTANLLAAGRIARVVSSCAPTAVDLGSGCTGAGGLNTLTATSLPLIGGTFRATGTGMPPIGFVLAVTGLSSVNVPLSLALPQALPGCTIYASADLIDVLVPVGGTASSAISFPANPALIGVPFFHQYVPLELDFAFNILAASSSNALQLTLGTF